MEHRSEIATSPTRTGKTAQEHEEGVGVAHNVEKAAVYVRLSADQRNRVAPWLLGVFLLRGSGVTRGLERCADYCRVTAD
jgi:TPR repeat protein